MRHRPFPILALGLVGGLLVTVALAFGGELGAAVASSVATVVLVVFRVWMQRPMGRVLLGTTCVQCGDGIFDEGRAEICPTCDAGMHARCAEAHRAKAHAAGPFR